MGQTLFEIEYELQVLSELAADPETPWGEVQETIEQWFKEIGGNLEAKLDGYCSLIGECEARAEARKEEARRLVALEKADRNLAKRLRERLLYYMTAKGIKSLKTKRYNLGRRVAGGKAPLLTSVEAESLPREFQKVTVDFDKTKIREALEAGERVRGCVLGPRTESLVIR